MHLFLKNHLTVQAVCVPVGFVFMLQKAGFVNSLEVLYDFLGCKEDEEDKPKRNFTQRFGVFFVVCLSHWTPLFRTVCHSLKLHVFPQNKKTLGQKNEQPKKTKKRPGEKNVTEKQRNP